MSRWKRTAIRSAPKSGFSDSLIMHESEPKIPSGFLSTGIFYDHFLSCRTGTTRNKGITRDFFKQVKSIDFP